MEISAPSSRREPPSGHHRRARRQAVNGNPTQQKGFPRHRQPLLAAAGQAEIVVALGMQQQDALTLQDDATCGFPVEVAFALGRIEARTYVRGKATDAGDEQRKRPRILCQARSRYRGLWAKAPPARNGGETLRSG
jgi:hypothetical protein